MTPAELKAKQPAAIQAREIETDIGGTRTLVELKCDNCDEVPENRVIEAGIGVDPSSQVLVSGVASKMLFDTVLFGDPSFSDIAQERLIVPADGGYNFQFVINGSATGGGASSSFDMQVEFRVNGSSASPSTVIVHQIDRASLWGFPSGLIPFALLTDDFVEIFLTSGHNANITLTGQSIFSFSQVSPALADIKPGLMFSVLDSYGLHYCTKCDTTEVLTAKYPLVRWA